MKLHTASEVVSLTRLLENEIAVFYEQTGRLGKNEEVLRGFARENRRYVLQVQQAYNNVISDAFEGGFAFDIEADEFKIAPPKGISFSDAIGDLISVEEKMELLYTVAAEQARSLLPDVSRAFSAIARKRQARIERLREMENS